MNKIKTFDDEFYKKISFKIIGRLMSTLSTDNKNFIISIFSFLTARCKGANFKTNK